MWFYAILNKTILVFIELLDRIWRFWFQTIKAFHLAKNMVPWLSSTPYYLFSWNLISFKFLYRDKIWSKNGVVIIIIIIKVIQGHLRVMSTTTERYLKPLTSWGYVIYKIYCCEASLCSNKAYDEIKWLVLTNWSVSFQSTELGS